MFRVLIVDDNAGARKTLSDIILAHGYMPVAASTGREALDIARKSPPGIALVDILLEDMSGLELIRELKKASPDTQCVVVTGHSSQDVMLQAINTGVSGYLEKPYDPNDLLGVVRNLAEKEGKEGQQRDHAVASLREKIDDIHRLVLATNGFAREHGELLSAHGQWIGGHEKDHIKIERDIQTLSNRLWVLSGGSGVLAVIATILQFLKL